MKKMYAILLSLVVGYALQGQPSFTFKNPVLISGTNLLLNAKYRFSNVRAGTDALVTITRFNNGVSLTAIDDFTAGYDEAFQPYLMSPANTNGYVEFNIQFVNAGTAIPRVMTDVPVSTVDVDGEPTSPRPLYEFDMVSLNPAGYYINYDAVGTDLNFTYAGGWVTGKNFQAINFTGVDTANKDVMFSVTNANISSFNLRLGCDNGSTAANPRRKSLYFQRFAYATWILPTNPLINFTGTRQEKSIDLKWQLENFNNINRVILEKGQSTTQFLPLSEMTVNHEADRSMAFNYKDEQIEGKGILYRLKMVKTDGTVQYSNVLIFNNHNALNQVKIFPSVIESSANLKVITEQEGSGVFQFIDYSGRILHQQNVNVQPGMNNIRIENLQSLSRGSLIARVTINDTSYNQKVYKQ